MAKKSIVVTCCFYKMCKFVQKVAHKTCGTAQKPGHKTCDFTQKPTNKTGNTYKESY